MLARRTKASRRLVVCPQGEPRPDDALNLVLRNPTSVVDAGALLALVPSLESIDICSDISTSNAFYDHLTLNGLASGSLAPRLQSLIVGYVSNGGLFVDMVESRMKNAQTSNGVPAPFTRVQFFADDQGYHDHCDRLLASSSTRGSENVSSVRQCQTRTGDLIYSGTIDSELVERS
ncbi:hypothetical protein JOM56_002917 [Amanita muscaria]